MSSAGQEAIDLAESVGLFLDDWQQWVLREALSERSDGKWSAFEVGLIAARQNGKNAILEAVELAALFLFGDRKIIHSAHEFSTAIEHFTRMKLLIESSDELMRLMARTPFITSNGKEAIRRANGAEIKFKARSKGGGRGFTGDRIILDEAYDLPAKAIGALLPTMSTRPMAQVWYTSSAPHFDSTVLHALRKRGVDGDPVDRLFLAEWGNDPDIALDDVDAWYRANPSLGIIRPDGSGITLEFLQDEWRSMRHDPELRAEFAREVAGVAEGVDGGSATLPTALWAGLVDVRSTFVGPVSVGFAVSQERSWSAFGVAGRRGDSLLHVETARRDEGTGWCIDQAVKMHAELKVPIRIDPSSPAGSFIDLFREQGAVVLEVSRRDVVQATGRVIDAVRNRTLRHLGQASLDIATRGARTRGDGTWIRTSATVDITPLEAVTLAIDGVVKPKVPEPATLYSF